MPSAKSFIPVLAHRSDEVAVLSEASRNTQRGVVFGSRYKSFSPRSSSVMPIAPVYSPPERVVGMAI
jgi:hypothetical protein